MNAYERVPYTSRALVQTHPDRLATLAALFGLDSAPATRCRVLELGCGDGSNLLPMAYGLPESQFVGIDLAPTAVARGQASISALKMRNIALHCQDVMALSGVTGEFDYVIAHGLYSWVPPDVRDRILAICADLLSPAGVAYISYNTYPGGHLRDMVRGMMRFHVERVGNQDDPVGEARALLEFLASGQTDTDAYGGILRTELKRVSEGSEGYVFHDDLADTNHPVYFHEFVEHAAVHGLQFLAEADYFEMQGSMFTPAIAETLRHVTGGDRILREQYADFLRCRKFRQTLLCRQSHAVVATGDLSSFFVTSSATTSATPADLLTNTAVEFRDASGQSLTTDHPLLKISMQYLAEAWPRAVPFSELLAHARLAAWMPQTMNATSLLSEMLLRVYGRNLVSLHLSPARYSTHCGEYPRASALARLQAQEHAAVTNLRHENIELTGVLSRRLLTLLDGTRNRGDLIAGITQTLHETSGSPSSPATSPTSIAEQLEQKLAELARLALIEC